ncbi:uncharacterized protein LODBEIA_P57280 [Lodderomyces beijingensis]|uniref:Ras-GAP domain-containing protein n=1 Tax=Lodderomyces beijingensis TaxID=1775926 RepID=A0ABP0ZFG7_9ASCO
MTHQTAFHRILSRSKGTFHGSSFLVSTDSISWIHVESIFITAIGQLYSTDQHGNDYLLLRALQSCSIQIIPNVQSLQLQQSQQTQPQSLHQLHTSSTSTSSVSTASSILPTRKNKNKKNGGDTSTPEEDPPTVFIKTFANDKLYVKIASKTNFGNLIGTLIAWQNLKPEGLAKKWYSENKQVVPPSKSSATPYELLVCRFKLYGPLPYKSKNLNIISGPRGPIYQPKIDSNFNSSFDDSVSNHASENNYYINEGWFYTMGALNSNGILNFISELDGTLLYSIDVKSLYSTEIREIHNSIFNSSNVLFLGQLKELRLNNTIRTTSTLTADQLLLTPFLSRDGKCIASNQRVYIEFPLHIDLEDWFVGLNYFAKREYIGSFNSESKPVTTANLHRTPTVSDFSRDHFRVSKNISVDIIEAKFETSSVDAAKGGKIYAEIRMWGYPWSRTAIVNHTVNPFWKEEFSTNLPISTQMIHILIKTCSNPNNGHSPSDKIIGTIYVTPDILTKQISTSSTIMTSTNSPSTGIKVKSIPISTSFNSNRSLDIVRLTIYDPCNIPIGKLLLQVHLKEFHIPSSLHFKSLEFLLKNGPIDELVHFFNENVAASEFERVSVILLDIFQCLNQEEKFFKVLMEISLATLGDKLTNGSKNTSQSNVFNTLFRGSSIFSKALERYNIRIGQEYLEKVFGDFFAKINREKKNCEVDPRYVRLQEKAARHGYPEGDVPDSLGGSSDEEDDSEEEDSNERDERVKQMVENNFQNLYAYAEELWHKIYITSNDIPQQIKTQLKNFRTKVELFCAADDNVTSLNCVSAFIFLRFFCPAILNPKLFYLTKNHQTGVTQRTLTLIAKVLLNLANRQEFSPHKEPHLVKMNAFLREHQSEVYEYFDRITGRKNDFNEKILDLSHEVKRFDLGLDETSHELPTTPYLIDKYLRMTELVHMLDFNTIAAHKMNSQPSSPMASPQRNVGAASKPGSAQPSPLIRDNASDSDHSINLEGINMDGDLSDDAVQEKLYQIGSLEFEKSEFLNLHGGNETEGFSKSLYNGNEEIFSFINSKVSLKDIQIQSTRIMNKIHKLESYLEGCEYPSNYLSVKENDYVLWRGFTNDVLSRAWLDVSRNMIISSDLNLHCASGGIVGVSNGGGSGGGVGGGSSIGAGVGNLGSSYKSIVDDNALASLKLKFYGDVHPQHRSTSSISTLTIDRNGAASQSDDMGSVRGGSSGSIMSGQNGGRVKSSLRKWLSRKSSSAS